MFQSVCLDLAVIESQREQDIFNDKIRAGKNIILKPVYTIQNNYIQDEYTVTCQGDVYGTWIGGRLCTSGECTSDPSYYPNDSPAGW